MVFQLCMYERVVTQKIPIFEELKVNSYRENNVLIEQEEFLIQDLDGYLLRFTECK